MRIALFSIALAACGHSSPPPANHTPTVATSCPSLDARDVPGYPAARLVPGVGMATTMDPGLNTMELVYDVDATFAEVTDLYTRCIAPPTHSDHGLVFARSPKETLTVLAKDGRTRVAVRCERCY